MNYSQLLSIIFETTFTFIFIVTSIFWIIFLYKNLIK